MIPPYSLMKSLWSTFPSVQRMWFPTFSDCPSFLILSTDVAWNLEVTKYLLKLQNVYPPIKPLVPLVPMF